VTHFIFIIFATKFRFMIIPPDETLTIIPPFVANIMETASRNVRNISPVKCTDDAVGVQKKHWFIAIVNNNSERKYGENLQKLGYETYVPIQSEERRSPSGRKRIVERVVLSALVFVYVTELERKEMVKLPYINKFMTNRAGMVNDYNRHPLAIVPNEQINRLKFMLYHSEDPVTIESTPPKLGDRVTVIRGKLKGLVGNVIQSDEGQAYIVVLLDIIGCAKVKINIIDTEVI
jgi:transcription antitermination factor NusG